MTINLSKPQCYSALGRKPNQEDALYPALGVATEHSRVFLVCDGMGGHEKGEVASNCVAKTVGQLTANRPPCAVADMKQAFEQALKQAYHSLDRLDTGQSEKRMGTTLTFLACCTDGVLVAHIGDSRVYQLRPGKGIVFQTRDHSLVNDLIAAGELSREEARNFSQRNVITRAVQPHQEYPARASYKILTDILPGDVFFLCCDGVTEQLEDEELAALLLQPGSTAERLQAVEHECARRNTRDNNTAYLVEVAGVEVQTDHIELPLEAEATPDPHLAVKPHCHRGRNLMVIIVSLVAIALMLAFVFYTRQGDTQAEPQSDKAPAGQVQGTIQRHPHR